MSQVIAEFGCADTDGASDIAVYLSSKLSPVKRVALFLPGRVKQRKHESANVSFCDPVQSTGFPKQSKQSRHIHVKDPDDCQAVRADVPTATPPDGGIDVADLMVIIDMALNRQDCCSYYYGGVIY
ncbi:MAG: hypothetical protein JRI87_08910 [Deltaproteobacteria bacterium]|nr:hypothetical protein [Deltaproteobacteria bacterium]